MTRIRIAFSSSTILEDQKCGLGIQNSLWVQNFGHIFKYDKLSVATLKFESYCTIDGQLMINIYHLKLVRWLLKLKFWRLPWRRLEHQPTDFLIRLALESISLKIAKIKLTWKHYFRNLIFIGKVADRNDYVFHRSYM